jgi:2-oxoglutarate dehydrogenase E1 component
VPLAVSSEELESAQPTSVTSSGKETLNLVTRALTSVPEGFTPNPKLTRMLEERKELLHGDVRINWAFAEALSFGCLLSEAPVRLSGQDGAAGRSVSDTLSSMMQ